jgi:hypothetical protein
MTRKSTHGHVTAERTTRSEIVKATESAGWVVDHVSISDPPNSTDEYISQKYGKGRSILLTQDKEAYIHNVENGFVGYITYGDPPKPENEKFLVKYKEIMKSNKRKDFDGYIVTIKANGDYEKKPIPKNTKGH